MNDNEKFWQRFGGMIRKVRNDCPITPQQAQEELDSLSPADESPLSADEIAEAIEKVLNEDFETEDNTTDTGWVDSYAEDVVAEDVFALNRNKGEADPEVDALLDELRKKAADEEDGQDETGLETPKEPSGKGS